MDLRTSFQDGCAEITAALAAKGITPDSSSPEDIANAIGNISAKPLIFTSSPVNMSQYTDHWAELTTNDFKIGVTSASCEFYHAYMSNQIYSRGIGPSISYDASKGLLTFSNGAGNVYSGDKYGGYDNYVKMTTGGAFVIWLGTVGGK